MGKNAFPKVTQESGGVMEIPPSTGTLDTGSVVTTSPTCPR